MEYGFVFVKEKVDLCFMDGSNASAKEKMAILGGRGEKISKKKLFIFGREKIMFK